MREAGVLFHFFGYFSWLGFPVIVITLSFDGFFVHCVHVLKLLSVRIPAHSDEKPGDAETDCRDNA